MVPFLSLTPTVGEQFTILAFVIVVLGGLGNVAGAMVGGLVIGLVQTVGGLYLPGTGSLILVFAVFVLVLFFRPQGHLRSRSMTAIAERAPRVEADDPRLKDSSTGACLPRAARAAGRRSVPAVRARPPGGVDRRPHPDLRDHGGRVEPDEWLRRHVQLRPCRLLRHRCLHRRLPAGRARDLAVDRHGRGGGHRRGGRHVDRVPVPALPAGRRLLRAGDVRLRHGLPVGGAEPRLPARHRGLQRAAAAGELLVDDAVPAGQPQLLLDPAGDPGAGPGRHDRLRDLAPGAVRPGGA